MDLAVMVFRELFQALPFYSPVLVSDYPKVFMKYPFYKR